MTRRGWAYFAAMCVIWGIPYLLIKIAVGSLSPPTLVFFRTVIGAVILVPIAASSGSIRPALRNWKVLAVYTVVEVALPWLLLSDAERHISSSLAGLLIAAVPLIGSVLTLMIGGESRPDARGIGGLLVGFGGVAALLGLDVSGGDLVAVGEVGLVALGYSIGPLIIARRLTNVPPVGAVAFSLVLTAVLYAPVALTQLPSTLPSTSVLLAVGTLGVVCTAVAFLLFFALIAEAGPVRATMITYVNPAVALALGVALLGESLTAGKIIGLLLIAVGVFLASGRARQAAPAPDPIPTR